MPSSASGRRLISDTLPQPGRSCKELESKLLASSLCPKSKRVATHFVLSRRCNKIRHSPHSTKFRVAVWLILLRARMQRHELESKLSTHALHPHFAFVKLLFTGHHLIRSQAIRLRRMSHLRCFCLGLMGGDCFRSSIAIQECLCMQACKAPLGCYGPVNSNKIRASGPFWPRRPVNHFFLQAKYLPFYFSSNSGRRGCSAPHTRPADPPR